MKPKLAFLIATGLKTGLSPKAPGTCGSLLAFSICLLLFLLGIASTKIFLILAVVSSILGFYTIEILYKSGHFSDDKDPSEVVIDEIAGIFFACIAIEPTVVSLLMSLIFFRFFDILKPFPICQLERLPGSLGIMADDIGAGLVSSLLIYALIVPMQLV